MESSVTGVVSGQFDFGFANTTCPLTVRVRGLPLRAVAHGVASAGAPEVAVNRFRNIGDTTIRASVRKAGGDPDGVEFVEMPF